MFCKSSVHSMYHLYIKAKFTTFQTFLELGKYMIAKRNQIKNAKGDKHLIKYGVSQGSILGPILFHHYSRLGICCIFITISNEAPTSICFNSETLHEPVDIAENFNGYFNSVESIFEGTITNTNNILNMVLPPSTEFFNFETMSLAELEKYV